MFSLSRRYRCDRRELLYATTTRSSRRFGIFFSTHAKAGAFGDIERVIRRANASEVARLTKELDKKQTALEAARDKERAAELARQKEVAEAALIEKERQIRVQIEEGIVAKIDKEFSGRKSIAYQVDHITYNAVSSALYGASLEMEPAVYENYVFLTLDPHKLQSEKAAQLVLQMVVYWKKGENRLTFRYLAVEKRLRAPEPKPVTEPRLQEVADKYVLALADTLAKRDIQ